MAKKRVLTAFPSFPSTKDDSSATGFNGVFFGPPGAGKTSLLASMKDYRPDEKILLFDFDIGRESVLDIDMDYALPPAYMAAVEAGESTRDISRKLTWPEFRNYLDIALAMKDEGPYKTYGFDSLSSLYHETLFPFVEKKMGAGKDGRQYYYEAQKLLITAVRDTKTLSEYGINTIWTGHITEDTDGDITTVRLGLPKGIRNEILLAVNHVGYLDRKKNTEVRELHMAPPRKVQGPKLRQVKSGKQAPLIYEDPTMGKLLEALKKEGK